MEDNTESRESKEKSREDNTRSSESKEERRKSMEDNTRPTKSESEEDILDEGDEEADEEYQVFVGAAVPPSRAPSFFRKARPRKPREMINHHTSMPPRRGHISNKAERFLFKKLTDATTKHHVEPGQNIVLVRPKPLGQRNPKAPMEGDEEIIEEQAVCIVCFDILREENILKTECKCGNALIHEKCVADSSGTGGNNNCDYCEQEVQTFPVTLVRGLSSSTPVIEKKAKKKAKNVFGCFHG